MKPKQEMPLLKLLMKSKLKKALKSDKSKLKVILALKHYLIMTKEKIH